MHRCHARQTAAPRTRGLIAVPVKAQVKAIRARRVRGVEHIQYHKDGSVWARGRTIDGVPTGYWEWFRTNGVRLRSGYFEAGRQVGEWTTYDKDGAVYKVTTMRPAG